MTMVLESALYVTDLDSAKRFYAALLDQTPYRDEPGRHCFFRLDGNMLLLFNASETTKPSDIGIPTHGSAGVGHVCLSTQPLGLAAWRQRLVELGVEIELEFTWDNGAKSIYFRDPSNNSLEVAEPKLWEFG